MKKIEKKIIEAKTQGRQVAKILKWAMKDEIGFNRAIKQLAEMEESHWPIISRAFQVYGPPIIRQEWQNCHQLILNYREIITRDDTRLLMETSAKGRKERAIRFLKHLRSFNAKDGQLASTEKEREQQLSPVLYR